MISWCVERSPAFVHRVSGAGIRACIVSAYALLMLPTAFIVLPTAARAHVPLPESVLNPQTEPEAWNVLRLAVANIERLVREDRLGEVPDQASLCSPALRTLARLAARRRPGKTRSPSGRCARLPRSIRWPRAAWPGTAPASTLGAGEVARRARRARGRDGPAE